jgi:hypothetical protein
VLPLRVSRGMEQYRELRQIGRGNYGAAILCEDLETGDKVVVKKIREWACGNVGRALIRPPRLPHLGET